MNKIYANRVNEIANFLIEDGIAENYVNDSMISALPYTCLYERNYSFREFTMYLYLKVLAGHNKFVSCEIENPIGRMEFKCDDKNFIIDVMDETVKIPLKHPELIYHKLSKIEVDANDIILTALACLYLEATDADPETLERLLMEEGYIVKEEKPISCKEETCSGCCELTDVVESVIPELLEEIEEETPCKHSELGKCCGHCNGDCHCGDYEMVECTDDDEEDSLDNYSEEDYLFGDNYEEYEEEYEYIEDVPEEDLLDEDANPYNAIERLDIKDMDFTNLAKMYNEALDKLGKNKKQQESEDDDIDDNDDFC